MIAEINIKPTCPHYGICGGCKLYNSTYEEQLQSKQEYINKVMAKTEVLPLPIIPSPILYNYRNKVEFTFFNDEQGNVGLGFHEKGAFNKFVNLEQCLIAPLGAIEILKVIRSWANQHQLTAYNKKTKKGLLRYLIVRKSISNNSFLITLVTSYAGHEASIAELASQLQKICTLTGLLLSVQEDTADAALLNHCEVIFGDDFFMDKIGDSLFKISYNSFFQSNNLTAKILYDLLLQEIREGDKVLDLFCGAGTIGCYISKQASYIYGMELIPEAIKSAEYNAKLNGLDNLAFESGRIRERLANKVFSVDFDVVILDPPRSGTDKKTMARIALLNPKKIIYVACGYENLVYNLGTLLDNGYKLDTIQPLDMFPHTPHVETVICLTKTD